MKNDLIKLAIAVVFAVVATVLNILWVKQELPPTDEYVKYAVELPRGAEVKVEHLASVTLPGKKSDYTQIFIPWTDRSTLYGMKLTREVRAGDIALPTDSSAIATPPEMTILGPFRILSIGSQLVSGQSAKMEGASKLPITIITKSPEATKSGMFEEDVSRLMQILEMEKKSAKAKGSDADLFYISSLVVYPKTDDIDSQQLRLGPNEVALPLDLPGVPVIADFLLDPNIQAAKVGFVVPKLVVESLNK